MNYFCNVLKEQRLRDLFLRVISASMALLMFSSVVFLLSSKVAEKKSEKIEIEEGGKDFLEKSDFDVENILVAFSHVSTEKRLGIHFFQYNIVSFWRIIILLCCFCPKYLLYHSILI